MGRKKPSESQLRREAAQHEPLYISLGLDFGTAFSKVAWRDLGTDRSGIIRFDTHASDHSPFVDSVVCLDHKQRCHCPFDFEVGPENRKDIRYLKMLLAGQSIGGANNDTDLASADLIDVLSAYYLARLIQVSKKELQHRQEKMFISRKPEWYFCLGVPVTQYDSDVRPRFEKVLGLASYLSQDNCQHFTIDTLREAAGEVNGIAFARETGAQVYPEIGAAVLSFVTSPAAPPGVYIYFDIGGGTMDGVCFRLHHNAGNRSIEYFSGRVEPLGFDALGPFVRNQFGVLEATGENSTSWGDKPPQERVRTMVAQVIIDGHKRDSHNWREARRDNSICFKWFPQYLSDDNKVVKLPVFLGGGGARSQWYRDQIQETYRSRKHRNNDIPPYELTALPIPENISRSDAAAGNYGRLAVAYGLAVASTTSVKVIGLPSKATVAEARRAHIDFDVIVRENYGDP